MKYRQVQLFRRRSGQARVVISLMVAPIIGWCFSRYRGWKAYIGISSQGAFLRIGDRLWMAYRTGIK